MQGGIRAPRPPEHHPPAVAAPDGADPQVALGPGLPLDLGEHRQPRDDVEAARGQQREYGDQRAEAPGAEQGVLEHLPGGQVRQAQQVPRPERLELGPLGPQDLVQDHALGGQRGPHGPGGELGGRDAGAQQGPGDRPGGRPHDDVRGARVPAVVVLEHREHAGVVGLSDDPTGPQDKPDTAHDRSMGPRGRPGAGSFALRPTTTSGHRPPARCAATAPGGRRASTTSTPTSTA